MCILDVEFFLLVYFGIRFIFINGDLFGLLNCVLGYIGLYQNKILCFVVDVFFVGGFVFVIQVKFVVEIILFVIMLLIISVIFFILLNLGYWLILIFCNKERLFCWIKLNVILLLVLILFIFVCGVMVKCMVIFGQFMAVIGL